MPEPQEHLVHSGFIPTQPDQCQRDPDREPNAPRDRIEPHGPLAGQDPRPHQRHPQHHDPDQCRDIHRHEKQMRKEHHKEPELKPAPPTPSIRLDLILRRQKGRLSRERIAVRKSSFRRQHFKEIAHHRKQPDACAIQHRPDHEQRPHREPSNPPQDRKPARSIHRQNIPKPQAVRVHQPDHQQQRAPQIPQARPAPKRRLLPRLLINLSVKLSSIHHHPSPKQHRKDEAELRIKRGKDHPLSNQVSSGVRQRRQIHHRLEWPGKHKNVRDQNPKHRHPAQHIK